ncbi:MAG: 3,4-dihydroxy-2-butanone-4-phosphate synthase [Thermoplasmata archaeon]|nr:3,4-dihydroxy-2-butanone-4-phosphate synthase [Thermoplasmata archaeon]
MSFERALEEVRKGNPILVYDFDDRERETDYTVASQFITPGHLLRMRKDAGGLVCTTMPGRLAAELGLPFLSDVFWDDIEKYPVLKAMAPTDIPYDRTKSSFGITINHRETYTGITDRDRALTITKFADTVFRDAPAADIVADLGRNFRAPGHVHLLNTTDDILRTRKGHTELCTAMMYMAGVKPSATICEMMGDDGNSRPRAEVEAYAEEHGIPMVTGTEVIDRWEAWLAENGKERSR